MKTDLSSFDRDVDKYLVKIKTGYIRSATQAMAQVMYEEAKMRAPVSKAPHMFYGTHTVYGPYSPGHLRSWIYQVYSKDKSDESKGFATYHVAWNHQEVPYGFMVEYGTKRSAAHPFLAPSYEARKGDAILSAMNRLRSLMA